MKPSRISSFLATRSTRENTRHKYPDSKSTKCAWHKDCLGMTTSYNFWVAVGPGLHNIQHSKQVAIWTLGPNTNINSKIHNIFYYLILNIQYSIFNKSILDFSSPNTEIMRTHTGTVLRVLTIPLRNVSNKWRCSQFYNKIPL